MIADPRNTRIDFDLSSEEQAVIEQAAGLEGRSVADFAHTALLNAAYQIVHRTTTTTLRREDVEAFLRMLDDEAPNEALKAAAERYKRARG